MYKIQAFVKVTLVTSAVVVNAVVFAITGVPWATADPPIDAGGGSSGGGGPPGGIADAPGGVSNGDGSWSATVGGVEYTGLDADDVGRLLWSGNKVDRLIVGEGGITRSVQVCEDFPEITFEASGDGTNTVANRADARLDIVNCTITLAELTHTTTGVSDGAVQPVRGPQTLLWSDAVHSRAVPVSLSSERIPPGVGLDEPFDMPQVRSTRTNRRTKLTGKLFANDLPFGWRNWLTETQIIRTYDQSSLRSREFTYSCDTGSPAGLIRWRNNRCTGGRSSSSTTVTGWAKGVFYATTIPPAWIRGNSEHSVSIKLWGYRTTETHHCRIFPESVLDLRGAGFLSVTFRCEYRTEMR